MVAVVAQVPGIAVVLPDRWKQLRPHVGQYRLYTSRARFNIVEAGRRSGKTEILKRRAVIDSFSDPQLLRLPNALSTFAAPYRDQAKDIWWDDLLALLAGIPGSVRRVLKAELKIHLRTGETLEVVGLDEPKGLDGVARDRFFGDEFADVRPGVWAQHIRPSLDTDGRPGRGWIFGVPRPSLQMQELADLAIKLEAEAIARGEDALEWQYHHWKSEEILSPEAMAQAKRDLDPLTYEQEYCASRISLTGRAYYAFERHVHAREVLDYDPTYPLIFGFDFNRAPGVASVFQDRPYRGDNPDVPKDGEPISQFIGEVWVPYSSTTEIVCRALIEKYRGHQGEVWVYGDATGGAGGSAKVAGSDWDIVERLLSPVWPGRVYYRYGSTNPLERARVNAVNGRFRGADGKIRALVCPQKAPHLVKDLELVRVVEGGTGEIWKDRKKFPDLTDISDSAGYPIYDLHPRGGGGITTASGLTGESYG